MEKKYGNVIDNIEERNQGNLNINAFEVLGSGIDYKTFFEAVNVYAKSYLEMGVKNGDIVTLCLAGTLDTVLNIYALNKIGAVAQIVNPNYFKVNSKKYINDTNSKLLVVMDRFYPILKEEIGQTNLEKIVLSSLTEYSSVLYKMIIRRQKVKKADLIPGVEYISLPKFVRNGERSNLVVPTLDYVEEKDAAIVYTSGTTGNPKGVVLTNDTLNNMISLYDEQDRFGTKVGDRNLLLIPPMYGTSLCHCINTPMACGCTTILQPLYKPDSFGKDLLKYQPNIVVGSKAHYISLLESDLKEGSLSSVYRPFTGGEAITKPLAEAINKKLEFLGMDRLIIGYGMSELGTMAIVNSEIPGRNNESGYPLSHLIKPKIINPLTGEEAKVNESGDLYINTPCFMKGYYKNEEATSAFFMTDEDGVKWGRTGDIATVDENGVYNVIGRKKDSIMTEDGQIVYLFLVEELIESIPEVKECEVSSLTLDGKEVHVAHIVPTAAAKEAGIDVVSVVNSYCAEHLKSNEVPFAYKIRDGFTTSPISGKRDYESLKYETEDYYVAVEDLFEKVSLVSDESKVENEIEKVKKLKI